MFRRAARLLLPLLLLLRLPHVALQLGDAFGELGVGRLWQLGVEALAEAPPATLLVFTLTGQTTEKLLIQTRHGKGLLGNFYLWFYLTHLYDSFSFFLNASKR